MHCAVVVTPFTASGVCARHVLFTDVDAGVVNAVVLVGRLHESTLAAGAKEAGGRQAREKVQMGLPCESVTAAQVSAVLLAARQRLLAVASTQMVAVPVLGSTTAGYTSDASALLTMVSVQPEGQPF